MVLNKKKITIKLTYDGTPGSGCIFNQSNNDYTYIVTAKHCLSKNPEKSVEEITKEDIEIVKIKIYQPKRGGRFQEIDGIKDVLIAENLEIDVAIIRVKFIPSIELLKFSNPSGNLKYRVSFCGYPYLLNQSNVPCREVLAEIASADDGVINMRAITLSEGREGTESLKGISGAPIFRETETDTFMVGIETSVGDVNMMYGEILGESISSINEVFLDNNLEELENIYQEEQLGHEEKFHSLQSWDDFSKRQTSPWVNMEESLKMIEEIKSHFESDSEENILYIVGPSGSGKSRAALETCINNKKFLSVMYFEKYNDSTKKLLVKLKMSTGKFYIVIDDVSPNEWKDISKILDDNKNLRIIAIGVNSKDVYKRGVFYKEKPQEDEVRLLLKKNVLLDDKIIEKIITLSELDLRFVILLKEYFQLNKDEGIKFTEINSKHSSIKYIFNRILHQHQEIVSDSATFKKVYNKLCLFSDIGIEGDFKTELEIFSKYFKLSASEIGSTIANAEICSLGKVKKIIFEPYPQVLANYIFETESWNEIKFEIEKFMNSLDETMKTRFLSRVEGTSDILREEVKAKVADWFRMSFKDFDLNILFEREKSKLFSAYSKFSNEDSLNWILQAIKNTDNLYLFIGRPRRYIIWLTEELVLFKENFYLCEEILFSLSQHETEINLGNNSRNIWGGLFSILFANSEMNFRDRLKIYLRRLDEASEENFDYVVLVIESLFQTKVFRIVPPKVVGGRIVPESWTPKSLGEIEELTTLFLDEIFEKVRIFEGKSLVKYEKIISALIGLLKLSLYRGYFVKITEFLLSINLSIQQQMLLKRELQEIARYYKFSDEQIEQNFSMNAEKYLNKIQFKGTLGRFIDVTNSNYWSFRKDKVSDFENECISLAQELILEKFNFKEHYNIIDNNISNNLTGFNYLVYQIGLQDKNLYYTEYIRELIELNMHSNIIVFYLRGITEKNKEIPSSILSEVHAINNKNKEFLLNLILNVEISELGFEQIMKIIELGLNDFRSLMDLANASWRDIIDENKRCRILETLYYHNTQKSIEAIISLNYYWKGIIGEEKRNDLIIKALQQITVYEVGNIEVWIWEENFNFIDEAHYLDKIDIALKMFIENSNIYFDEVIIKILKGYAKHNSSLLLKKIGDIFLCEKNYKVIMNSYKGLFEAFAFDDMKEWLDKNGERGAAAIARHLYSPDKGKTIANLTYYVLEKFEYSDVVFRSFLSGRHSMEVINFTAQLENHKSLIEEKKIFLNSELRRVSEWARYEIDSLNSDVEYSQISEIRDSRI